MAQVLSVRWVVIAAGLVSAVLFVNSNVPTDRQSVAAADNDAKAASAPALTLHARKRIETKPGSGRYHAVTETVAWDPKKTALVVCDMWDKHWCAGATRRVGEMAPRINELIAAARVRGVLIIHCPSGTLDFYSGTPQR